MPTAFRCLQESRAEIYRRAAVLLIFARQAAGGGKSNVAPARSGRLFVEYFRAGFASGVICEIL